MKTLVLALAMTTLVAGAFNANPVRSDDPIGLLAEGGQPAGWGQDRGGDHHWQRGERMGFNDWSSSRPVDYRHHHLRQPPRGYEWRESNGQYVLAAVATGLIASIMVSH
jgi:Ni/Co efflux regulator RcnB